MKILLLLLCLQIAINLQSHICNSKFNIPFFIFSINQTSYKNLHLIRWHHISYVCVSVCVSMYESVGVGLKTSIVTTPSLTQSISIFNSLSFTHTHIHALTHTHGDTHTYTYRNACIHNNAQLNFKLLTTFRV